MWEGSGRRAAANGSLMRTAPIGVFFAGDPHPCRAAALAESALTHFDPRCRLACAAFDAAIADGIRGGSATAMVEAAWVELDMAAEPTAGDGTPLEALDAAVRALRDDLRLARADDPDLYGEVHLHRHEGFVRVAFRLAFWELVRARLSRRADRRGEPAAATPTPTGRSPARCWARAAERTAFRRTGRSACSARSPTNRLATMYHPRELMRLGAAAPAAE